MLWLLRKRTRGRIQKARRKSLSLTAGVRRSTRRTTPRIGTMLRRDKARGHVRLRPWPIRLPPGWKEAKDPATGHALLQRGARSSWTRPLDAAAAAQMKGAGVRWLGGGSFKITGTVDRSGILLKPTKAEVPLGGTAQTSCTMQPPPPRGAMDTQVDDRKRSKPTRGSSVKSWHGPQPKHEPKLTASAPRAAGSIRAMPPVASGRKRQRAADASIPWIRRLTATPVGGWGAGLASSKSKRAHLRQWSAIAESGDVLRQNAKAEESKGQLDDKSREGLGEAD